MATEDGTALLQFGTVTVTGFIIEGLSESEESEDLEIFDEDGDIVTHINNYGQRRNVTVTCIPKSGTSVPSVGDTFTYTSGTNGATQKFTVLSIDAEESNRDVVRWTLTGKSFSEITLS